MPAIKPLPAIALLIVLVSCATPTPAAVATPIPTHPPRPTATTATTPTATPTETPAPASLNASGPYIMFQTQRKIWITNPDGSALTQVYTAGPNVVRLPNIYLRDAISPTGDRLAVVQENNQGLDLLIVKLPRGETETIAHLISLTRADQNNDPASPKALAEIIIQYYSNVAWQPGDGRLLAFTGAMNGPTSDLYLYDTLTRETRQLTSGSSQAIYPVWSPDGQYIIVFGVHIARESNGAINPDRLEGVWAVRASDGKLTVLPSPADGLITLSHDYIAWQDDSHYIMPLHDDKLNTNILTSVDIASGETKPILDFTCYSNFYAHSPVNGALLFTSLSSCAGSRYEGTFLLLPGQTTPLRLLDNGALYLNWLPESRVFDATLYEKPDVLFSADGKTRYDAPPSSGFSENPAVSKAGYQAWAVQDEKYRWFVVVKVPGQDWHSISVFAENSQLLIWDPLQGNTLLFNSDGSLYAASYPDFTPRQMASRLGVEEPIWLP